MIFEIPLDRPPRLDVLVVWREFEGVGFEDRRFVLEEAYRGRPEELDLVQLLGVTAEEAVDQQLLSYKVESNAREDEVDPRERRQAMLDEGAVVFSTGHVRLLFPNLRMAAAAHRRLTDRLPQGNWALVHVVPVEGGLTTATAP